MSKNKKNRCSQCQKKVGLIGFTCKCEKLFCSNCRHPKMNESQQNGHICSFDYKKNAQETLKKNNPVIETKQKSYTKI